jgi:glycosyltransferase involved in cell wall biosynthesis
MLAGSVKIWIIKKNQRSRRNHFRKIGGFMKLVINIPCLNEEKTLPQVLSELPARIDGIDQIEVQVVDDGSSDRTAEIAEAHGCRLIRHKKNLGLGIAFKNGIDAALAHGADILVNTDADNQYPSRYIPDLIRPIMDGSADVSIGNRQTWKVKHFSFFKRFLQWFGSASVRLLSDSDVKDTVSGFRAYSRESLLRLNVKTRFSYVLDTIMQCSSKNLKMVSVDITPNPPTRKSRLFRNMFQHIRKSAFNLIKIYIMYRPFMSFLVLSILFLLPSLGIIGRFLYFYFTEGGAGHIQSLIAAAMLFTTSVLMLALGIIVELVKYNRELIEEQLYLTRKSFYKPE